MTWYDTREGITKAVKKGIPGLRELRDARREAGYSRNERMKEWCVIGLYSLDRNGNFDQVVENAPRNFRRHIAVDDVMTLDEARRLLGFSWVTSGCSLPPIVETCDRCLHGWDMHNIEDYRQRQSDTDLHRHASCQTLYTIQKELEFFSEILGRSEMPYTEIRIIPNEYHSGHENPWFLVETKWGPLRIGGRSHVISIDWSGTQINHNGGVTFKDENVTKDRTMIHAWGKDKAVEYLKKLSRGN